MLKEFKNKGSCVHFCSESEGVGLEKESWKAEKVEEINKFSSSFVHINFDSIVKIEYIILVFRFTRNKRKKPRSVITSHGTWSDFSIESFSVRR